MRQFLLRPVFRHQHHPRDSEAVADHPGRYEPGTGEMYYNRVLQEAYKLGYKDFVGLECNPTEEIAAAKRVAAADVW